MDPVHIHEALAQVREMKARIVERNFFRGYSGYGRMCGGVVALAGAFFMSLWQDPHELDIVAGWGVVLAIALVINIVGLFRWWRQESTCGIADLRPLLDLAAPLFVGGVLTLQCIEIEAYQMLVGVWACLFGVANVASRHCLAQHVWHIGWYYIMAGVLWFYMSGPESFLNPWPMGLMFFMGEMYGGLVFIYYREERV